MTSTGAGEEGTLTRSEPRPHRLTKAARARLDAAYRANAGWRHATDWSVAHRFRGYDARPRCGMRISRYVSDPCPGDHEHCKRCEAVA